jgi:glycosyltransferase involved in cell wall biosynthesis
LNETFIAREIIEMERRGFDVTVVPLRSDPHVVGAEELPEARVLYTSFISGRVFWGALSEFLRNPLAVLRYYAFISIRLLRSPARLMKFYAILPKTLYLIRRFRRMNVVHIHSHWATVPTTCALFISSVLKTRFSFSAHAWDIYVTGNDLLLKEKIECAERVFTCTEANKRRLSEFGPEDKIEVMYHGIEIDRYPFVAERPPGPPFILAGGSLVPQKGLDDLIEALAILHGKGVSFQAEILGEGPLQRALQSQIDRHVLGEKVKLIGRRPHSSVIVLMQRATVFVMPSKRARRGFTDGLPNVVAEAMACGACVAATRYSGIPELVGDGIDGLLVEPGDFSCLAEAIESLLSDPGLRDELRRNARTKVETMFDIRKNVKPLVGFFERLLAGGGQRTAANE